MHLGSIAALALLTLAACSGSSSSSGAGTQITSSGTLGQPCSSSSPCASGLTCAQSGSLTGRCTADCSGNLDLCNTQFGASSVCMDASQCALTCTSVAQCPSGSQCVELTGGSSACIPNPSGSGDAGLANGECQNLGGAFGDTVQNGGYRCTPTANGQIGTGIDKCANGTWVSAYDCTCLVTSSISGQQNPSECFDISAPGTAQCSYALDYCAQCDPVGGCQSH